MDLPRFVLILTLRGVDHPQSLKSHIRPKTILGVQTPEEEKTSQAMSMVRPEDLGDLLPLVRRSSFADFHQE
jgi:hypothetical protein